MECEIQIRGGVPLAVDLSGNVVKSYAGEKWLIAGDRVYINELGIRLVRREPHYSIAVVTGFKSGVLVDFPFHPGLQTVLQIRDRVCVGDRLFVEMRSDGQIQFVARFSGEASQDLVCSRRLYDMIDGSAVLDRGVLGRGPALYTRAHADLAHLETFTVDPASSVDLDDAISIDVAARRLYIHIVDIHTAVPIGSYIEERMYRHGATLYLAERVQHLLPDALVERVSLDCGARRRAITVEMTIGLDGNVESYDIYSSGIVVKHRYNYEQFEGLKAEAPYSWLKAFADKHRASLPLCIPGLDLKVGADGMVESIGRNAVDDDAHRMIACAMIAANFTVAAHLRTKGVLLPSRFHEAPAGLFAEDVAAVTGHPVVDSYLAVKKWRPARYDLERGGHFGLGLREYVHFTSPMRRYPDVIIHRILAGVQYDAGRLGEMVDAINRRAAIVRQIQKYYTGVKIARHLTSAAVLNTVYVTRVASAGVSWYSPEFLVNGFTHVSKIGTGVRWSFNKTFLAGGGRTIAVGDVLSVAATTYNFANGLYDVTLL
jgi:exoribonuclease R